jgi:three-Cys-motif partner protein
LAGPKEKLWKLDAHTRGKHEVLRRYLNAWLPILGTWQGRILFIDGFSGPGEYEGGEPGSPLIALDAFRKHKAAKKITAKVVFFFIEKRKDRAEHLLQKIEELKPSLPTNCSTQVICGVFDETMSQVFEHLDEKKGQLAPSLVMVDPFGVSDTPMSVIRRILSTQRCEVYVTVMYEFINRFATRPEFHDHLDALYGCADWRKATSIADSGERKKFFYDLYKDQLRQAGAKQVVHFDLYEGNRLKYAIFFGTQNPVGSDRMKAAIWGVAPTGDFAFRGTHSKQLTLGEPEPNLEPLKEQLTVEFQGKEWVRIEDVEQFVMSDRTDFHKGQLKRKTLAPMEKAGRIKVDETTRKRKGSFPEGALLRFV